MKNLLILTISALFIYGCGTESKPSETTSLPQKDAPQAVQEKRVTKAVATSYKTTDQKRFRFSEKVKLPSEIWRADSFYPSFLYLVVRRVDMIYFLDRSDPSKIIKKFQMKKSNGEPLAGKSLEILGKVLYMEKLDIVVFFSQDDDEIYYYDSDGQYRGTLKKPTNTRFKPAQIVIEDLDERGVYILSMGRAFGEVYFWESLESDPRLVLKGHGRMDMKSIASGSGTYSIGLHVLLYEYGIFSFEEEETSLQFKLVSKIDQANNVNTNGLFNLRTYHYKYFVVFGESWEQKQDDIRIFDTYPNKGKSEDLLRYKITEYPPDIEAKGDDYKNINDLRVTSTGVMYVLCGSKLYKYVES